MCACHSVVSDSLRPHGLQPIMLLCPWDSPGKNTGVGCRLLFQAIFLTQGSNPCLPLWQADSLLLSHQGSPFKLYIHPTDTMTMKINELLTNNMVESHKHNTESKRLKREYTVWFQLFKVKKWKLIYGKGGFLWGEGNSDLKGTQEGFLGDW